MLRKMLVLCALAPVTCAPAMEGDSTGAFVSAGPGGSTDASEDADQHCSRYGKNAFLLYRSGEGDYQFVCE